jgi:uncharacterized membrane protein YhaH (DUF805 family)
MPDPKDYMNDDHEFVKGYVRRKQADGIIGRRRRFWFWNIAWYWRLLIIVGIIVLVVAIITKYPIILLSLVLPFIFWLAVSSARRKRKQGKPLTKNRKIDLF